MECPPGNVIGHVEQNLNIYRPSFDICDANGDTKYVIEGPSSCKTRCTYFFYCFASFDWVLFGGFFFFLFCYDIYFYLYVYKFPLFTVVLVFVDRHLKMYIILRISWGFLEPPTRHVRTFSLYKVRENWENCHFLDHPPTLMTLRNIKMVPYANYKTYFLLYQGFWFEVFH